MIWVYVRSVLLLVRGHALVLCFPKTPELTFIVHTADVTHSLALFPCS